MKIVKEHKIRVNILNIISVLINYRIMKKNKFKIKNKNKTQTSNK